MNKIKNFVFSEKRLGGAIFGVLIIVALAFVFGPNLYAQFARQDGPTGWGYGNGYGYGYGSGFDGGTFAGYRTTGGNLNQYGYGYGYGYRDSGVTYNLTNGYSVTPANMSNLVKSGVIVPNSGNINSTTNISFTDKVTMTVASGVTITIPSGTIMSAGSAQSFASLAASNGVSTTGLSGVIIVGNALSFGVPNLDLTVSPAITITMSVDPGYNGLTFNVYRKDTAGWNSDAVATCLVTAGTCTFTTTHLSSFATGASTTTSSNNNGGGSGSVSATPQYCTDVTYGDYATTCFGNSQFRSVASRTPANCTLTPAQQSATARACTSSVVSGPTEPTNVDTSNLDNDAFITLEKSLVTKVNSALAKRLAGRILLQVEGQGQAWYVNPVNGSKYFLGRPADAFAIMRKLALGVSNKTWATFKNGKAPARLAGRILLKVEDKGMAYYVNPIDLKMYYLGRPADAFSVMRSLGLGVTNANLRQISVMEIE